MTNLTESISGQMKTVVSIEAAKPKRVLENGLFATACRNFPGWTRIKAHFIFLLADHAGTVPEDGRANIVGRTVGDGLQLGL